MMPIDTYIERLKILVLEKASISEFLPFHSTELAALIFAETQRMLSESTLLRIYDLVPAKFPPSSYTRDALACFCSYDDFAAFVKQTEE